MHINRYNYEEYFLLYTDNELSLQERQAVEEFVDMNPEFADELALLQQYKLVPEEMVFAGKKSLMKMTGHQFIDADNYEMYFLLHADNELNAHQRACVEQFVQDHPALKEEFDLIHKAVASPDHTVRFPDKQLLRRRKDDRVIPFAWWKAAAAAAVVLVAGALWLNNQPSVQRSRPVALQQSPSKQGTASAEKKDVNRLNVLPSSGGHDSANAYVAKKATAAPENIQRPRNAGTPDGATEPVAVIEDKRPAEAQIADVTEMVDAAKSLVFDKISATVIQEQKPVIDESVAFLTAGSDDQTESGVTFASGSDADEVYLTNVPIGNKHALRGLFRKASRIINKATTLNTGEKGIHIGNLEIAMK